METCAYGQFANLKGRIAPYKLSKALPATLPFLLYAMTLSGAVVGAAGLVAGALGQDCAALADALRILSTG